MAETHRDDIAKLEALYTENPEGRVFIHLAEAYRRAGELDRALEVVQDGISRYPEDSSAHVVLGRVLEDRQQDEEAGDAFRRVLELDAHNLVALRGLGDLEFRAGHHKAALEYFERLAELEPPDAELEALIEALREGPAAMTDALQQQGEAEPAVESRPEAVDFSGGTLEGEGAFE
ncbi:MAG: tetratricopeptide repeat protein, partial [Gemmatimonadota bacterium]